MTDTAMELATALLGVERFTEDGNFHPDYLAMLTRPLPQPSELVAEVKRLTTLADDHFRNARRLSEVVVARDAQITKLQADGDKLAGALVTAMIPIEAILLSGADAAHCQDVRDALRDAKATAPQALTEWKDRA